MTLSPFHSYFCLGCNGLRPSTFITSRFQKLRHKLQKNQPTIVQKTLNASPLEAWKQKLGNFEEILVTLHNQWVDVLTVVDDVTLVNRQWENLLINLNKINYLDNPILIIDVFIDASRLLLTDVELLWCWEYQQVVYVSLKGMQQRYTYSLAAGTLAIQVIKQTRRAIADFSSENNNSEFSFCQEEGDLNTFQSHLETLLLTWHETMQYQPSIVAEIEFLKQFIGLLVVPHPMPQRFWKLLLLELDCALSQQASEDGVHTLTEVIEVLIVSIERFDFIRYFFVSGLPHYAHLTPSVGDFIMVLLLLKAHEEGRLFRRLWRTLNGLVLLHDLSPHLKKLTQLHRQILRTFRSSWGQVEIEWLIQVIKTLNTLLSYTQQSVYLLKHLNSWCQQTSIRLYSPSLLNKVEEPEMEKGSSPLKSSQSVLERERERSLPFDNRILPSLLAEIIWAAGLSIAITQQLQPAQELFRRIITLHLGPDRECPIWQQYPKIQLALQSLTVNQSRSQKLLRLIRPILATFSEIVEDNLNFSANWFGAATAIETVASQHQGCQHLDLVITLRQLAKARRLYTHQMAVLELKRWYATTILGDVPAMHFDAIYAAFSGVNKIFKSRTHLPPPQPLLQVLQAFINTLPDLAAGKHLLPHISQIADQAIKPALVAHSKNNAAQFVESVKWQLENYNSLLLMRAAQIFSSPIHNQTETLLWWWNYLEFPTSSTQFPTDYSQLFEANLIGLHHAISSKLTRAETDKIFGLISTIYEKSSGISYPLLQNKPLNFVNLTLEGPLWQRWFAEPISLLEDQHGINFAISALIEVGQIGLNQRDKANIKNQFETFIENFFNYGDPEAAWQRVQPLFEGCLRTLPTRQLENAWRRMLLALSQYLTPQQAAYWENILKQGIFRLRQVGLGHQLQLYAPQLAVDLAHYLHQITTISKSDFTKCERDILLLLNQLSQLLRTQCPTLVTLNMGRYLIECVIPFITYSAYIWQMLWMQLKTLLQPKLDKCEQIALAFWISQLEAISIRLPATHTLGKNLFGLKKSKFAEPSSPSPCVPPISQRDYLFTQVNFRGELIEEEHWCNCLSGLLTATLTPRDAPIPGYALVQRLLLSSQTLHNVTVIQWQAYTKILSDTIVPWLETQLRGMLTETHAELMSNLLTLTYLEEKGKNIPKIGIFCTLLSHLPHTKIIWQSYQLMQASEGYITSTSNDLLVSQSLGCECFYPTDLKKAVVFEEADQFQGYLTLIRLARKRRWWNFFANPLQIFKTGFDDSKVEISDTHLQELKLFLRTLALHSIFKNKFKYVETDSLSSEVFPSQGGLLTEELSPLDDREIRKELFEMLFIYFDDYDSSQQMAILTALSRDLAKQYGAQHPLTQCGRHCVDNLFITTLAIYLLNNYKESAREIIIPFLEKAKIFPRSPRGSLKRETEKWDHYQMDLSARYFRDTQCVLHRLGLMMAGLLTNDLTQWKRLRWATFLNHDTPDFSAPLLQNISKVLAAKLTKKETQYLEKELSKINKFLTNPTLFE